VASGTQLAVQVETLVGQDALQSALKLLESAREEALASKDIAALHDVLAGTRLVHAHADRKHRNEAVRIANAAQQNIRLLGRKQALAAGEEWVDPFGPPAKQQPTGASMIPGFLLALVAVAVFVLGAVLELSVRAFYTGLVVLWFVAPPFAATAAASFLWSSGSRRVREFVGVILGDIVATFIAGLMVTVVIYSHS